MPCIPKLTCTSALPANLPCTTRRCPQGSALGELEKAAGDELKGLRSDQTMHRGTVDAKFTGDRRHGGVLLVAQLSEAVRQQGFPHQLAIVGRHWLPFQCCVHRCSPSTTTPACNDV